MLADTVEPRGEAYGELFENAFHLISAFFVAEFLLRLIASPGSPGNRTTPWLVGTARLGPLHWRAPRFTGQQPPRNSLRHAVAVPGIGHCYDPPPQGSWDRPKRIRLRDALEEVFKAGRNEEYDDKTEQHREEGRHTAL